MDFPGSVYLWACEETLDPSDEDVAASEVVAGWITILVKQAEISVASAQHEFLIDSR